MGCGASKPLEGKSTSQITVAPKGHRENATGGHQLKATLEETAAACAQLQPDASVASKLASAQALLEKLDIGSKLQSLQESSGTVQKVLSACGALQTLPYAGAVFAVAGAMLSAVNSVNENREAAFAYVQLALRTADSIIASGVVVRKEETSNGALLKHLAAAEAELTKGLEFVRAFSKRSWAKKLLLGSGDVEGFERCEAAVAQHMDAFYAAAQIKVLETVQELAARERLRKDFVTSMVHSNLEFLSKACELQLSRVSLGFLPAALQERLQNTVFSSGNFNTISLLQSEEAVQALMCKSEPSNQNEQSEQKTDAMQVPLEGDGAAGDGAGAVLDQLICFDETVKRSLLVAPAGFGKSVLLKYMAMRINRRAADARDGKHAIAMFVRADHLLKCVAREEDPLTLDVLMSACRLGPLSTHLPDASEEQEMLIDRWSEALDLVMRHAVDTAGVVLRRVVLLVDALDELPSASDGTRVLQMLQRQSGHSNLRFTSIVVSSRPGALFESDSDGDVPKAAVTPYSAIKLSSLSDIGSRRYLRSLCDASGVFGPPASAVGIPNESTAGEGSTDKSSAASAAAVGLAPVSDATEQCIDSILQSLPGDKSPLLLLLALSAVVTASTGVRDTSASAVPGVNASSHKTSQSASAGAPKRLPSAEARGELGITSRYALYNTICTQAVQRKVTERWHQAHPLECGVTSAKVRKRLAALEISAMRLLACYAAATDRLGPSGIVALPDTLGPHMQGLFGDVGFRILLSDLDEMSQELKVGFRSEKTALESEPASLLPLALEQVSGLLSAGSGDAWAFVHKSFEEFFRGVALSETRRGGSTVYDSLCPLVTVFLSDAAKCGRLSPSWRAPLEFAAYRAGPLWVLDLIVGDFAKDIPTYLGRLSAENRAAEHFISHFARFVEMSLCELYGVLLFRSATAGTQTTWMLVPDLPTDGFELLRLLTRRVDNWKKLPIQHSWEFWKGASVSAQFFLLQLYEKWKTDAEEVDSLLNLANKPAVAAHILNNFSGVVHEAHLWNWFHMKQVVGSVETLKLALAFAPPDWVTSGLGSCILHNAILSASLPVIDFLLDSGVGIDSIDNRDYERRTALMFAQDSATAHFVLQRGAQVEALDKSNRTALMVARDGAITRFLLQHGAQINARDKTGGTALTHALEKNKNKDQVVALIEAKADVDAICQDGTPLIIAARHGKVELLKLLLDAKADPSLADNAGAIPLVSTLTMKKTTCESIRALAAAGADFNPPKSHFSPLSFAASLGVDRSVLALLLELGAQIPAVVEGTPACCDHGVLLEPIESVIISDDDSSGHSPEALRAKRCIDCGGPVAWRCRDPEHCFRCANCVRLVDHPLIAAVKGGHVELLKLLLDAKADPNAADKNGWTPLIYAIHSEVKTNCECIRALAAAGANFNPPKGQLSPLSVAVEEDVDRPVLALLLELGAQLPVADVDAPMCHLHFKIMEPIEKHISVGDSRLQKRCADANCCGGPVAWYCSQECLRCAGYAKRFMDFHHERCEKAVKKILAGCTDDTDSE